MVRPIVTKNNFKIIDSKKKKKKKGNDNKLTSWNQIFFDTPKLGSILVERTYQNQF